MPGFAVFVRCVCKAAFKHGGKALARLVPFGLGEFAVDIAYDVYEEYRKDHSEAELRAALQGLALASPAEVHQESEKVVSRSH